MWLRSSLRCHSESGDGRTKHLLTFNREGEYCQHSSPTLILCFMEASVATTKSTAKKPTTSSTIINIKVHFELNTPNGLRRVVFGLEKDTQGKIVTWKIDFQLFERKKKSDPFGDAIVTLNVEVKKELHDKAEKAAAKGLSAKQSAHALGPAAEDARAAAAGEIEQEEAEETVQGTLNK